MHTGREQFFIKCKSPSSVVLTKEGCFFIGHLRSTYSPNYICKTRTGWAWSFSIRTWKLLPMKEPPPKSSVTQSAPTELGDSFYHIASGNEASPAHSSVKDTGRCQKTRSGSWGPGNLLGKVTPQLGLVDSPDLSSHERGILSALLSGLVKLVCCKLIPSLPWLPQPLIRGTLITEHSTAVYSDHMNCTHKSTSLFLSLIHTLTHTLCKSTGSAHPCHAPVSLHPLLPSLSASWQP